MSRAPNLKCNPMPARKYPKLAGGSLADYNAKRDFQTSPEPTGSPGARKAKRKPAPKKSGLIFCVQKHLASHLHYDFRLEHNGVLLSWAVPKGPSLNPADKRLAMRVEDHPYDYADFEGVIPEGYGAGIVMVWDKGTWTPEPGFEDVETALVNGELKFRLDGIKLKGSWVLVRTHSDGYPEGRTWLLIKHRDEWAGNVEVTRAAPDSVKSFGDFAQILAKDNPDVWQSHRPAKGGVTGKLLAEVIERAASLKANAEPSRPQRGRKTHRSSAKARGTRTTKRPSRAK
jgi:bifunctional non-homologous end joining protein LigD